MNYMNSPIKFKESFKEKYEKLLGVESERFFKHYSRPILKSIRTNTLKISPSELKSRLEQSGFELIGIPWCKEGFWILKDKDRSLAGTLEYFLGYYYIQEAASMIPPIVLDPKPYESILDLTAAPGSKTTQIAAMMENTGMIVANDIDADRIKALKSNLNRCGIMNSLVTRLDGRKFQTDMRFDRILVDAPCSNSGSVTDPKAMKMWDPNRPVMLSYVQKSLLNNACDLMKANSTLVYSTCSLCPEEDEAVIDFILRKHDDLRLEKIKIRGLITREGLSEWNNEEFLPEIENCARIYPHDNDSDGFFIAKLVKK